MTDQWMTRPRDEHDRIEGLALGSWLPAATTFSPYWRERAELAGASPEELTTREDLARLDTVTEDQVRGVGGPGGPALVMRPTEQQVKARADSSLVMRLARSISSGGAAAKRATLLAEYKPVHVHRAGIAGDLTVAYTRSDLDRLHRCGARAARVLGLTDRDVLVSAVPAGTGLEWWGVHHLALGSSMLSFHPRTAASDDVGVVAPAFDRATVTVVAVREDEAVALADALVAVDTDLSSLRTVVVVGTPPDDEARAVVHDAFAAAGAADDLVVRALFAPAESRAMWAEPRSAPTGLVTYPDLEVVEVVDAVTGRATDGAGDLTITSLGWHGTALLRYQTGWYVTRVDRDPCPQTGITAPRVVGPLVEHPWQPWIDVGGGELLPLDFRAGGRLLGGSPDVDGWRIELRGPTQRVRHDRVLVEVGGEPDGATLERLQQEFAARAGVLPTAIRGVDAAKLRATVEELGSPFADGR